jgi:hypothetical protein
MKVKDLFHEVRPEHKADTDKLAELIKTNCPNNFKSLLSGKAPTLFRGDRDSDVGYAENAIMFFKSKPRFSPRRSLTSSSFINSYVAASVDWGMIPDRQMSAFCSTDIEHARDFGSHVFLIIPFDNVKTFASVPQDWNDLTINNKFELTDFSDILMDLQSAVGRIVRKTSKEISDKFPLTVRKAFAASTLNLSMKDNFDKSQVDELLNAFNDIYKFLNKVEYYPDRDVQQFVDEFNVDYRRLFGKDNLSPQEFLHQEFTPAKMHVELYNGFKNLIPHGTDSPEIWFEGQFIAMSTGTDGTETLAKDKMIKDIAKRYNLI